MFWRIVRPLGGVLVVLLCLIATAQAATPTLPGLLEEEPIFVVFPHDITGADTVGTPLSRMVADLDTPAGELFVGVSVTITPLPSLVDGWPLVRDALLDPTPGVHSFYVESDPDVTITVAHLSDVHVLSVSLASGQLTVLVDPSTLYVAWDLGNGFQDHTFPIGGDLSAQADLWLDG